MDYTPEIIRSRRRTLSVEISRDLRVIVRAPLRLPQREIARFLSERAGWIEEHLARARRRLAAAADLPKLTDAEQQELRRRAKETIPARVEFFARKRNFIVPALFVKSGEDKRVHHGALRLRNVLPDHS